MCLPRDSALGSDMSDEEFRDFVADVEKGHRRREMTDSDFAVFITKVNEAPATIHPSARYVNDEFTRASTWFWGARDVIYLLALEAAGRISLPHNDAYVMATMCGVPSGAPREWFLANSAEFRECVWRFFEVPGGGEVSLANLEKYGGKRPAWRETFLTWARDGSLDRQRLLASCLEALGRDFGAYVSSWYSQLFTALEPTIEEVASLQHLLRPILTARAGPSVTLAVGQFVALQRAGLLDSTATLAAIPAVSSMSAGNAKRLVRLVAQEAEADPSLRDDALRIAESGLIHSSRDVQAAAVALLATNDRHDAIAQVGHLLSPTLVVSARSETAKVEAAGPRQWAPFRSWEAGEAAEGLAILLEDASDPLAVEAALLAFTAHPQIPGLSALRKRAISVRQAEHLWGGTMRECVARLVLSALDIRDETNMYESPYPPLVRGRFDEVEDTLRFGGRRPLLLATPESEAGWIEPEVLVERLERIERVGATIWRADFASAILRLDVSRPTGRPSGKGEHWDVLRHALGFSDKGRVRTVPWWVAAARISHPDTDDPLLKRYPRRGQSRPVSSRIILKRDGHQYENTFYHYWHVGIASDDEKTPAAKRHLYGQSKPTWVTRQPTVLQNVQPSGWALPRVSSETIRFAALSWPASTEFVASISVQSLFASASATDGEVNPPAVASAIWALRNVPAEFGELGRGALALGLAAKTALERAAASELLIDAVSERTSIAQLGVTMGSISPAVPLNRWAVALRDAATISEGAHAIVRELLTVVLPLVDPAQSGVLGLVELLEDELVRANLRVQDDELRAWLGRFSGSGKSAKSARALLAL
jgi:hypothetical protein